MVLKNLTLTDFRNYKSVSVPFYDGINVIYGANAGGKTNLLEAVFCFAAGKSFRGCKDRELIRFGAENASASITFESGGVDNSFRMLLVRGAKKRLFGNGCPISKLSEYLGHFRAVVFTPDHLDLIKGAPEGRRRFTDMAICQSFPRYVAALNEYGRLLAQKNALLRVALEPSGRDIDGLLDIYNERMSVCGAAVTVNRRKYLRRLEETASPVHSEMSGCGEKLTVSYSTQSEGETQEELRESYIKLFECKKEAEKQRGTALYGPHKDDFSVHINGKAARLYASQGQQRTAVLALKLAEGELSKSLTGEYPVFLFDDILSELDAGRRSFILGSLSGRQVIITGCEEELFGSLRPEHGIYVKEGECFVS